jgi:hypothetical protein
MGMPASPRRLRPFTDRVPATVIHDLRSRLRATRLPEAPADAGWSLGTDVAFLRDLIAYWADGFDWTEREAELMALPRFIAPVSGVDVHVVHARATTSGGPAMPLILTHGWPDAFWRYSKVIPLLTDPAAHGGDPADAFDVVVPDMPGFGYSGSPAGKAFDSTQVAAIWAELMTTLGYDRFAAAGGDIGSHVSRYLALDHPDRVLAVHRTDGGIPPTSRPPSGRGWRTPPHGARPRAPTPPCTGRSRRRSPPV